MEENKNAESNVQSPKNDFSSDPFLNSSNNSINPASPNSGFDDSRPDFGSPSPGFFSQKSENPLEEKMSANQQSSFPIHSHVSEPVNNSNQSKTDFQNEDEEVPHYPISDEPAKDHSSDDEENSKNSTIITTIIAIIIIISAIWYFNKNDNKGNIVDNENQNNGVNIVVNANQEQGEVKIVGEENFNQPVENNEENGKIKIIAYYNNSQKDPNMPDCSRVYPLEREIEKKYDSEVVNAIRGLLTDLSPEEKSAGWVSSIPVGTFLNHVQINNGMAVINFNSNLNKVGGSCAVSAIRAQIEQTLLQFSYVNAVTICIDSNCQSEEILQP